MNNFEFHSVGQGLFYTGSLVDKIYNFVYDCGTENKRVYLETEIDNYVKSIIVYRNEPEKDFVVISHLHRDHISGLPYLLEKCNVKKIYLPYLGEDSDMIRMALTLYIYFGENEDEEGELSNDQLFHFTAVLYGIEDDDKYIKFRELVEFIKTDEKKELQFVYTKTFYADSKSVNNRYWQFNLIQSTVKVNQLEDLYSKLNKTTGYDYKKINIIEMIKTDKCFLENIKKCYYDVFGKGTELNLTSLMLMHYPLYPKANAFYFDINIDICEEKYCFFRHKRIYPWSCRPCIERSSKTISILTGDAMIDGPMLKEMRRLSKK